MKFFTAAALFIAAAMAAPTNVGTRNENAEDCNCTNPEQPESHDGKPSLNVYKDTKGIFHWGTGPVAAQNYECQPHQEAGVANLLQCVVNVAPIVAPVVIPVVTVQPEILSTN